MIRIKPNISAVLENPKLQANLRKTLSNAEPARLASISDVDNWEELRDHARAVKLHTLGHLDRYLLQLEEKVKTRGGSVFWASSDQEAVDYVVDLARRKGVRSVVKSKTMLGEEIRLNEALEESQVRVVETDLGEYIVQLSGEPPFHIVTPAFHKSKEEVSQLFSDHLGTEPTDDVGEMTLTARRVLREQFLQADMGISGVNFGIAETGTLVVVENEGNARLSTSLPRIHVALMGIEKVLPRARDLAVFLKLLTRSATGQKITSYINLISGPRREGETDGPEEFHLVIVDNGRSSILQDEFLGQTLACIRCGACLNSCPVYQRIGGHAYNSVYQGPIGAILMPQLLSPENAPEHPFASSLCGACREVCPVKIEIPHILLRLRQKVKQRKRPFIERLSMRTWGWLMSSPSRYRLASAFLQSIYPVFWRNGRLRPAVPPVSHWQRQRDLPQVPRRSFRDLFDGSSKG